MPEQRSIIDQLVSNAHDHTRAFQAKSIPAPPRLKLVIVTCMDARMNAFQILGIREGDAQILRNAGGAVTDDTLRSLTVSQRLLGTQSIMIIHHTNCGLLGCDEQAFKLGVQEDVGTQPPWPLEAFNDLNEHIVQSITRIQACPFLLHKEDVRGFVYSVENGQLREVQTPDRP